jgi:hypothetical protein
VSARRWSARFGRSTARDVCRTATSRGAFDDPATSPEPGAGVPADPGDARGDAAATQVAARAWVVVARVAEQLGQAPSGMAAAAALDPRHAVQDRIDEEAVLLLAPETGTLSGSPWPSSSKSYFLPGHLGAGIEGVVAKRLDHGYAPGKESW